MAVKVVSGFPSEQQISAGEGSAPILVTMVPFTCAFWGCQSCWHSGWCPRAVTFGWLSSTDQQCEHPFSPGIAAPLPPSASEHRCCFCSPSSGHWRLNSSEGPGCPTLLCCSGCSGDTSGSLRTPARGHLHCRGHSRGGGSPISSRGRMVLRSPGLSLGGNAGGG